MSLRTRLLIALVVVLVSGRADGVPPAPITAAPLHVRSLHAPQSEPPPRQPARGTASVSGRVVAADSGRPIGGARVLLSSSRSGAQSRTGRTDASGRFEIEGLPAGLYDVTVTKEGYIRASVGGRASTGEDSSMAIVEGQRVEKLVFELVRGGVITGRVLSEDGDPLPRLQVRALRVHYTLGERRLTVTESDRTDDRGEYRLFGLSPGRYYVAATMTPDDVIGRSDREQAASGDERLGYAATYYPTTTMLSQAMPIAVAGGVEVRGIDFMALSTQLAEVSGAVISPGSVARASVHLIPDEAGAGATRSGIVSQDGTFRIRDVAPGSYLVVARDMGESPGTGPHRTTRPFAVQSMVVAGHNISGIVLVLGSGATISGTMIFQSGHGRPAPHFSAVHITLHSQSATGLSPSASVPDTDGAFVVTGVPPVPVLLRATVASQRGQGPDASQWHLKEVWVSGRDVIDTPFQTGPDQQLADVMLVFGDRVTTLRGTLKDSRGAGVPFRPVVVFPADEMLWAQPHSRRLRVVRTNDGGGFEVRGLPPGHYLVHALDRSNEHEWNDPDVLKALRLRAVAVVLDEDHVASVHLSGS
jgi:hypothetical protein